MFLDLRRPSVVVLDRLRVAPPSSFAALESSPAPEGSRHDLREHDPEWSLKPPGSVVCGGPQRRLSTSFERLRLFSSVTFALPEAPRRLGHHLRTPDLGELVDASYLHYTLTQPSGRPTFARGRSPTMTGVVTRGSTPAPAMFSGQSYGPKEMVVFLHLW